MQICTVTDSSEEERLEVALTSLTKGRGFHRDMVQ